LPIVRQSSFELEGHLRHLSFKLSLQPFDRSASERTTEDAFGVSFDLIEDFFGEQLVARNSDGGDNGVLPGIETVDLRDRDVETLAEAIF